MRYFRALWLGVLSVMLGSLANAKDSREQVQIDFRKGMPSSTLCRLVGNNPQNYIRADSSGLHVALPSGGAQPLPQTGFMVPMTLVGDFEITLAYEIAKRETPSTGYGCGAALFIQSDSPNREAATLAALESSKGELHYAANRHTNGEDGKRIHARKNFPIPFKSQKGYLRLSRSGTGLSFAASVGREDEIQELRNAEFGAEPVTTLRVVADPGGSTAAIEIVFSELHIIKSGKLTTESNSGMVTTESAQLQQTNTISSLWIIGVSVVITGSLIGGFVWWRKRRRST
jgi:hypothetical protein